MSCTSSVSSFCTTAVLAGTNIALLAGSGLVLYASIHVRNTGWLDVIDTYWGHTDAILMAINILVGIVAVVALLGLIAACCNWQGGLCAYASIVSVLLLIASIFTLLAFLVHRKATQWEALGYPAQPEEVPLKNEFDKAYCYAQGEYMCNTAPVTDIAAMLLPGVNPVTLLGSFAAVRGVNGVCNDTMVASVPQIKPLCDRCTKVKEFQEYSSVVDWANNKCPRTNNIMLWCGTFLVNGSVATGIGKAPYGECRAQFLNFVDKSSLLVGSGGIIIMASLFFVAVLACFLGSQQTPDDIVYFPPPPGPPPPGPPPPQPVRYVVNQPMPPPPAGTVYRKV